MKVDPTRDIPTRASKPESWIIWHKALKSNFGKKQANALFTKAWTLRGTSANNTSELRNYLEKNGIVISSSAWDKVVDKGGDISDWFGDGFMIGKYVGISVAVIIVGGLAMLVYNIAKAPNETIGAVGSVLTKGKK